MSMRLILAAAFLLAGAAKLRDRGSVRDTLRAFRVPRFAVTGLAAGLAPAELAIGAALVVPATATAAAWAAATLLAAFTAAIVAALSRDERPTCRCFGALSAAPIGPATLARNGALLALAAAVGSAGPGSSIGRALSGVPVAAAVAVAALVVVLAALIALAFQLLRQNSRLLARVDALEARSAQLGGAVAGSAGIANAPGGLPIGVPAPAFAARDERGEVVTLDDLLAAAEPIALAFSDPGCRSCALAEPVIEHARSRGVRVFALTAADAPASPGTLHREDETVMADYRAHSVPSAVIVGADGRIASELAIGDMAIADLLHPLMPVHLDVERHG